VERTVNAGRTLDELSTFPFLEKPEG